MDVKTMKAILNTLNQIEVKGANNMDMLLACIRALNEAVSKAEQPEQETEGDNG